MSDDGEYVQTLKYQIEQLTKRVERLELLIGEGNSSTQDILNADYSD